MTATSDDERIEAVVRAELEDGRGRLERALTGQTTLSFYRHPRTDEMQFTLGGRYASRPDRDVYAMVEIDPRRRGWHLEGMLWEYPDSEEHDQEVRSLGGARVEAIDSAIERGRMLARAAWVAVHDDVASPATTEGG